MDLKNLSFISKNINPEKLILISGNGQNVGKTTYACLLIQHFKKLNQKVYALKISPHIHDQQPPHTIFSNDHFIVSLEKEKGTGKDSSRYLDYGADESFFLQVTDERLEEAANYVFSFFPKDAIIIVESGGLRKLLKPQLFFFLINKTDKKVKKKAIEWPNLADKVIEFDGMIFNFPVDKIQMTDGKLYLID